MVFLALESVTNQYNLYVPHEPYTPSELSAMAYHGVLRPQFGPYYVDADLPDTASQRAKSVRMAAERLIEGDWTATLLTAAWIYLGGHAPEMLEAATALQHRGASRNRVIPTALRHADYLRHDEIDQEDLRVIGGIVVTCPELTIEELLRIGGTRRHQLKAQQLCAYVDMEALDRRFSTDRPGMQQARDLLQSLDPVDLSAV